MPFYLSGSHGEGTRVWVAPAGCTLVVPAQISELTVGTLVAAGESVAATWTADVDITPIASIDGISPFLTFVDPASGEEILAEVIDGSLTSTGATVNIKKDLPAGAKAVYPSKLGGRASVNLASEDETAEVENFDNDGWKDYVMTALGQTVSTTGPYMALDAGYLNAMRARLDYQNGGTGKVALIVELPAPNFCPGDDTYSHGLRFKGVATVSNIPIESGAKAVIQGNIDFQFTGPVEITLGGRTIATPVLP